LYSYLKKHRKILVYFPLIIYWIILLIATSIPTDDFPRILLSVGDKIKHFIAYAILAGYLTLAFAVQERVKWLSKNIVIYAIIVASLYGIIDEFHQSFIPGRFFEMYDWLADILGAIAGSNIINLLIKKYLYQEN
jgi:VanZ family protein